MFELVFMNRLEDVLLFSISSIGPTPSQLYFRLDNIYNQSAPDGEQNISDRVGDGVTDDRYRTLGVISD